MDEHITSREAAELLGVSRQTFIRGVETGAYPLTYTVTPGGHRRYRTADVTELAATIDTGEVTA